MSDRRRDSDLPPDLLEAIDGLVRAAEQYGWAARSAASGTPAEETTNAEALGLAKLKMAAAQRIKGELVRKIHAHASRMFEDGCELGRSSAKATR